ncbi:HNH endonuclease family protein [Streptomyces sp. NPDC048212]|uniref:HNH endonuclease family protein n=1 Tax=unclassified Streptomyces TaxID=2593676 RepID=UPI002274F760|nr:MULTISPECIES: HNH endonuclease family protein [unclassified Streptomyces]MCY1649309.1 HNH endonuclease family protein [Streptomyces sp. SL203]MCY1677021.1 HNH endonuclease family protein [Streptomyces sp. SL294]
MINNVARSLAAAALTLVPLLAAAPVQAAEVTTLADGVRALPLAAESRTGYERSSFKHWGDADKDSCNTRMEVLIAESRIAPTIEAGCKVTAGSWYSYYDGLTLTAPGGLDIDHMVPLAEAWDSGASQWTPARREAYANDLGSERSLVAVTAKTNRSKADQDPSTWLPPLADARCTYAADWVATKLRWGLTVDQPEADALTTLAESCGQQPLDFEPATDTSK